MRESTTVSRVSSPPTPPVPLLRYEAACSALAAAKQIDEVRDIRDRVIALKAYAHQAKNRQLEIDAAEIRIRAERRLGELMQAQRETVGLNRGTAGTGHANVKRRTGGSEPDPPVRDARPTLEDAGIDKHLADRARRLSEIPPTQFETLIGDWRERVSRKGDFVKTNVLPEDREHHARYMKRHRKAVQTGDFIEQPNGRRLLTDVPRCYSCGKPATTRVSRLMDVPYCGQC